jgi:hypothetical protein
MYLHCSISIFIRVIRPTSFSAAADSTPQCIFIALFQFLFGLFARRASPPRRTPPRNVSSLLYFNFFSGYSPDVLLRRGGLNPAMYLHCFISFFFDSLIEGYEGMIFFLIYQINRAITAVFG